MARVPDVTLTCPTCTRELPPIPVVAHTRVFDRRMDGGFTKSLTITIQPMFTDEWWIAFREGHPECARP